MNVENLKPILRCFNTVLLNTKEKRYEWCKFYSTRKNWS